jgi:cell division protein FtsB
MPSLKNLLAPQAQLLAQEQRIRELEQELASLQAQNDSMRAGMRRCVSCEYRIDYKLRQEQGLAQDNDHTE